MKNYLTDTFNMSEYVQYFDEIPIWSAPFGLKLLDAVNYKRNLNVLDVGFGSGFPLIELSSRLGQSATIYGVDTWSDVVNIARKKIEYFGLNNIRLLETTIEQINIEDNSIDLITSNNGINNVENVDAALAQCYRILKPQGQFLQTMNLSQSMFEFYDILKEVLSELNLEFLLEEVDHHILKKRPTVDSIKSKMSASGFKIKKLEYDQFDYKFVDGTALLNHYFIRIAFMGSWRTLIPMEQENEIFDKIEERLNKQADIDGFVKLSIPFILIEATKD